MTRNRIAPQVDSRHQRGGWRAILAAAIALAGGAAASGQTISVGELSAAIDPWTAAGMTPAEGGLRPDLWRGSDAGVIAPALLRLKAQPNSATALSLARRALLSGGGAPANATPDLSLVRVDRAAAFATPEMIVALADRYPDINRAPTVAIAAAEGLIAAGRQDAACTRAARFASGADAAPYFLKLRAYCFARAGDIAAANLNLDIARAADGADAWFGQALGIKTGAYAGRPPAGRYRTALEAAISSYAGLATDLRALAAAPGLALGALAAHPDTAPGLRIEAAQRAAALDVISPAQHAEALTLGLAALASQTPAPVIPAPAASFAAVRNATEAPDAPDAGGKAALIAAALEATTSYAGFAAAARLYRADLQSITPSEALAAHAQIFAEAALATYDPPGALAWRRVAANLDPQIAAQIDLAVAALSGLTDDLAATALENRLAVAATPAQQRAAMRDVMLGLALGMPQSSNVQRFMIQNEVAPGARVDLSLLANLVMTSRRAAVAETALLATLILQNGGVGRLDPIDAAQVIRALREVDLEDDARQLAIEAMLAARHSQ